MCVCVCVCPHTCVCICISHNEIIKGFKSLMPVTSAVSPDSALTSADWIEQAHQRQQLSPPVTLYSPGHSCAAAIMSLAVALMSLILPGGKRERAQRPHLIWVVSTTAAHLGNYACNTQTNMMRTRVYKRALAAQRPLFWV